MNLRTCLLKSLGLYTVRYNVKWCLLLFAINQILGLKMPFSRFFFQFKMWYVHHMNRLDSKSKMLWFVLLNFSRMLVFPFLRFFQKKQQPSYQICKQKDSKLTKIEQKISHGCGLFPSVPDIASISWKLLFDTLKLQKYKYSLFNSLLGVYSKK